MGLRRFADVVNESVKFTTKNVKLTKSGSKGRFDLTVTDKGDTIYEGEVTLVTIGNNPIAEVKMIEMIDSTLDKPKIKSLEEFVKTNIDKLLPKSFKAS